MQSGQKELQKTDMIITQKMSEFKHLLSQYYILGLVFEV